MISKKDLNSPVAILAFAISCSNVRGVLPVHDRFWFRLVQVCTNQICKFPSFVKARMSDGTDVPISPAPASSSNLGSPNGSLLDLEGTGFRASSMEEKINDIHLQLPLSLAQTVAAQTTKITNIEQNVGSFAARVTSLEANEASGSSSPDSARSWNMLGQSKGSTATGSLGSNGPGSSDKLVAIHYKAGFVSATLVFETRAKCQDFVARDKDDGIPCEIDSPTLRQSKSLEDWEIGKQFAPLWRSTQNSLPRWR